MAKADRGLVTITANGVDYELVPTPAAMKGIDRHFGSTIQAVQKLRSPALDDVVAIIGHGAQVPRKEWEALEDNVFREGVMTLVGQVMPFLEALLDPSGNAGELGEGKG